MRTKSTTNAPIPKPIHRRAKRYAEREGRFLQVIVGEALQEYLNTREQHNAPRPRDAAEIDQS